MRFNELSVKAISYHDTLNPVLWDNNKLKTEVRYKLLLIAKHFIQFLKVNNLNVKDITLSGSNASYGYSDYSDIDLHIITDIKTPEMAELFTAKKNQYNFKYDLKIKDIDVELYVQDSKQPHHSAGIYSVMNDTWVANPKHQAPIVSEKEVRSKARNYAGRINTALKSDSLQDAEDTMANIRRLRQAGLESGGENSVENLAFKLLRSRGQIDKLVNHIDKLQSTELSLKEKR
jgi:hypothetical protein